MDILYAIVLGGLFGAALYVAGATNQKKLISMLNLKDLTIMKIILFAIGFGSFLLAISSFLGIFDISHLSIKSTNLALIIGAIIFGVGFGGVGSCPGTCIGESSSGFFRSAITIIVGGLFGAFSYSLLYGYFKSLGIFNTMDLGKLTLFSVSSKFPHVINIGFIGILVMGIILMAISILIPQKIFNNKVKSKRRGIENLGQN